MTARHTNTYGKNNINIIINNKLCIHCGACSSICPTNAITWNDRRRTPIIIDEKCVDCGLCLKICPSHDIYRDYYLLYKDFSSFLMGPVLEVYLAWSKNSELRYNASSGGFITQLLLDLMKLKLIEGAIVTIPDTKRPYLAKTIIAEHPHEILDAKGSKYTITSPGLLINELLNKNGRYAVVGLPCHILMFKKAEKLLPELKNKIALYIGLFCGHIVYPEMYYVILNKELGYSKNLKITHIRYRGDGWPGCLEITLSDGTKLKLPHDYWVSRYFESMIYIPKRCKLCNDATAELADIAVGDPWIDSLKKRERLGISLVILRTVRGKYYFTKASEEGNIAYVKVPNSVVAVAQITNITFKKVKLPYRLRFAQTKYNSIVLHRCRNFIKEKSIIERILSYIGSFIIMDDRANKMLTSMFKLIPKKMIWLYSVLTYFLFLRSSSWSSISKFFSFKGK